MPDSPLYDFHFKLLSNLPLVSIPAYRLAKGSAKERQIIKERERYMKEKSACKGIHLLNIFVNLFMPVHFFTDH